MRRALAKLMATAMVFFAIAAIAHGSPINTGTAEARGWRITIPVGTIHLGGEAAVSLADCPNPAPAPCQLHAEDDFANAAAFGGSTARADVLRAEADATRHGTTAATLQTVMDGPAAPLLSTAWNTRGYARAEGFSALNGAIRFDTLESESVTAALANGGTVGATAARVVNLRLGESLAFQSLAPIVPDLPNQVLVNAAGVRIVFWETNWDPETLQTTDGLPLRVSALHITDAATGTDIHVATATTQGMYAVPTTEASPTPDPDPSASPTPDPDPSTSPDPDPDPDPSPSPDPDPSTSPDPDPEPDPSTSPDPSASPTPDPDPSTSPDPDPDPSTSPDPDPDPSTSPDPDPDPRPGTDPDPDPTPADPDPTPAADPDPTPGGGTGEGGGGTEGGGDADDPHGWRSGGWARIGSILDQVAADRIARDASQGPVNSPSSEKPRRPERRHGKDRPGPGTSAPAERGPTSPAIPYTGAPLTTYLALSLNLMIAGGLVLVLQGRRFAVGLAAAAPVTYVVQPVPAPQTSPGPSRPVRSKKTTAPRGSSDKKASLGTDAPKATSRKMSTVARRTSASKTARSN